MDKLLSMLGLAMRAGRVTFGTFLCMEALAQNKAQLIILAEDMSERTKKDFIYKCDRAQKPCLVYADKKALGRAIGRNDKTVVCVTDENFAQAIVKIYGGGLDGKTKNT